MTDTNYWVDFVAGWCAGAAGVVLVQPVDTLLTRYQAGLQPSVLMTISDGKKAAALYRGAWPMIYSVPLQNMLLMGGYGIGQSLYAPDDATKYAAIFVSGSLGGVAQSFLMSPIELIKIQRQCQEIVATNTTTTTTTSNNSTASSSILWKRLVPTRGLGATILRDGLPHGVWFVSYQWCKDYMEDAQYNDIATPLVSGAVAAIVAWTVGYPADLIKTKIQYTTTTTTAGEHLGIWETTRQVVQTSGWRGLYKGFTWKLVRAIPASMVGFGVYEMVKKQILEQQF